MHLKQLKLAGFKSFVDLITVPFPSQLVAVVGPNGCGKSNLIDAVRWVMGESSAKNLRGESMTDVIFNGSSQRKSVGQASVELVFDNSLGRLTGQYASYQALSVKRLVTRDGESTYFLNNTRCRRRDITDIFLGTGAGARGYSIIGQGTISRIIEARPEELRAYLEEAAGISKYKERRRETMLRIEHTQENLARVADIRVELEKQLRRLEGQAKAAEQYKELTAQERLYKAEILAMKWQGLTTEQKTKQDELMLLLVEEEQYQIKLDEVRQQMTVARVELQKEQDTFQQMQASFYQLAAEIARLDESLQQQQREKERLLLNQQQMQEDWQTSKNQLQQDADILHASEWRLKELETNLQTLEEHLERKQQILQEQQEQHHHWLTKTQQVQMILNKVLSEAQVEQIKLEHLMVRRQQFLSRVEKINEELILIEQTTYHQDLETQQATFIHLKNNLVHDETNYQDLFAKGACLRQQLAEAEKQFYQTQDKAHALNAQLAGLMAIQHALLKPKQTIMLDALSSKPHWIELIKVEKEWQLACELVFTDALQGVMIDSFDEWWSDIKNLQGHSVCFMTANTATETRSSYPRLLDKIDGPKPNCWHPLDKIFVASSLEEAFSRLIDLKMDESVITAQGCWFGKGWVKFAPAQKQDDMSLLAHQEELTRCKETLAAVQRDLTALKEGRDYLRQQVHDYEQSLERSRQNVLISRECVNVCGVELTHKKQVIEQVETRRMILNDERDELVLGLESLVSQQEQAEQLLTTVEQSTRYHEKELQQLEAEKSHWEDTLFKQKQIVEDARAALHQERMQVDREHAKIQQLNTSLEREQSRLITIEERLEGLATGLAELEAPDATLSQLLQKKNRQHGELQFELTRQKKCREDLMQTLDTLASVLSVEEHHLKIIQSTLQQKQMDEQALAVRATSVLETLMELNDQVDVLLAALPSHVTQELREQQLQDIVDKIKRLGAINLAAIDEYKDEFQRKHYLDEQHDDLTTGLATLNSAIEKMDKEMQQRLRITFHEVNTAFQSLFPRLFGGGRAMLELTCDNLLEAGIVVMAQPPGKRNSTIHLLSGGEKAMTAVALVFAIFQLNPSPFCMLDEVDAPLDDVNVGRFCALVKEMSQCVQFLFITHNKITMELADHLIGVTMHEPGVSRVVAVDVEQALSLKDKKQ